MKSTQSRNTTFWIGFGLTLLGAIFFAAKGVVVKKGLTEILGNLQAYLRSP